MMVDSQLSILQSGYFTVPQCKGNNSPSRALIVICEICRKKNIDCKITGYSKSTANFKKHLKLEHPEEYLKYEKKTSQPPADEPNVNKLETLNINLLNYMIKEVQPLSQLSNRSFQKIFTDISKNLEIMNEKDFIAHTKEIHSNVKNYLTDILAKIEYVALTFDTILTKDANIFIITAHWLDYSTFERKSVLLSCRVNEENDLKLLNSNTVSCYVVKVCEEFKLYQDRMISLSLNNIKKNCFHFQDYTYDFQSSGSSTFFDSQSFQSIDFSVENRSDTTIQIYCASNALLEMATVELTKTIPEMYLLLHKRTFYKCAKLWKATTSKIKDQPIYWSEYIHFLIEVKYLNTESDNFSETELKYLDEFLEISKCLLRAMESLHKDNFFHYGYLLPVLLKLREDLKECKNHYIYFTHSASDIIDQLDKTFENILSFQSRESYQAIIACTLHPKIKLKWMSRIRGIEHLPENLLSLVTEKCIAAVREFAHGIEASSVLSDVSEEIFIDSEDPSKSLAYVSKVEEEVKHFLLDRHRSYDVLQKYPNVRKAFFKYNAPICSSRPVTNLLLSSKLIKAIPAEYENELIEMIPVINCFNDSQFSQSFAQSSKQNLSESKQKLVLD